MDPQTFQAGAIYSIQSNKNVTKVLIDMVSGFGCQDSMIEEFLNLPADTRHLTPKIKPCCENHLGDATLECI
jgi:hypothetical protein